MSPRSEGESAVGRYEARRVAAELGSLLEAARATYRAIHDELAGAAALSDQGREDAIVTLSEVAISLRRAAPAMSALQSLPLQERPDLVLVLLRLLTDSLAVALADPPLLALMVDPDDVDELVRSADA